MHRIIPVQNLIYSYLYPKPSSHDPPNFSCHLARNLIPEIRIETNQFYGSLDSIEARYPGLNYTFGPHVRRLSQFPHHRRLFSAIKHLTITDHEILDLARWEGTLWARERYEKDEGITVVDTTASGIGEWKDPRRVDFMAEIHRFRKDMSAALSKAPFPDALRSRSANARSCDLEVQPSTPSTTSTSRRALVSAMREMIEHEVEAVSSNSPDVVHGQDASSAGTAGDEVMSDTTLQRPLAQQAPTSEVRDYILQAMSTGEGAAALASNVRENVERTMQGFDSLLNMRGFSPEDISSFRAELLERVMEMTAGQDFSDMVRMGLGVAVAAAEQPADQAVSQQVASVITQPAG